MSSEISRTHRQRLLAAGFLQEATKGWLISSSPAAKEGDSTPLYASFWEFCAKYCRERFGESWHLSPEQSLLLLAENTVVPTQVVVYSPAATNYLVNLVFGTSIYALAERERPADTDLQDREGLRLFNPASALVRVPEAFYERNQIETQVVLRSINDSSDVLRILLNGGHSKKAGVLAGAFRRIGRPDIADDIVKTMQKATYDVRESDPFSPTQIVTKAPVPVIPIVSRLETMWATLRASIIEQFPKAPGLPDNKEEYLRSVDEIYVHDAYHSLSIEGYSVSPQLIERVREGTWDPENHDEDRKSRDALAARGYWQAFQEVKKSVMKVISGDNAGDVVRMAHRDWYREMFQPCVTAGLIPAGVLAGYRNDAVYLRTSRYVPPRWEVVRHAMPALFDLLRNEPEPSVRALLGHWQFGYIHPYPDENGRTARFLMNVMLASGGYPWTVITKEDRNIYLKALDAASIEMNVEPFVSFVSRLVDKSMKIATES